MYSRYVELAERGPQPSIFQLIGVHLRLLAAKKKISSQPNGGHNSSCGWLSLCLRISPRRFKRAALISESIEALFELGCSTGPGVL